MNYKKDCKKPKPKIQLIQPINQKTFMSPAPKKNPSDLQLNPMNLRDLSPYPLVYTTCHTPNHLHFSNTQLAIIETPASHTYPRISYLQQIDEAHNEVHNPISGVIVWQNGQDDIQSKIQDEQSSILQISQDQSKKSSENKQNPQLIKKYDQKKLNSHLKTAQSKLKKDSNKKIIQITNTVTNQSKKVFCNCKKTKCLKLYCDCFRINQTCDGCNCVGCHNLSVYQQQRNNAMLSLMDRNPQAFKPKIDQEQHAKGCHCKKSNCLKKYCECFQAGLKCGINCKCQQCKNKLDDYSDHGQDNINSDLNGSFQYNSNHCNNKQIQISKQKRIPRLNTVKNRKMEEWAVFT